MKRSRRGFLQFAGGSLIASLAPHFAQAQTWPARPIHAVVPISPGTGIDIISRLVLSELSLQLGQPIVVDNRPGAGGTIGAAIVAKAEPDGYTILTESSTHTSIPFTYAHLAYDPVRDLSPVVPLGTMPLVLVCAPSRGFKSIDELVSAAMVKPGSLSYGSGGTGTATHLPMERLQLSAGFRAIHVPFRGASYAAEIMSGRIDFGYTPLGSTLELIRDGRLLALAVSSRTRASILPNVPTTVEAGFINSEFSFYVGMFVPAKTPRAVIERLNLDTTTVVKTPNMQEKLAQVGAEPMIMTSTEFDAFIRDEFLVNEALIRSIGLAPI
jgi:tripartite-type tricarboxylate transporter receptor subunit TctC